MMSLAKSGAVALVLCLAADALASDDEIDYSAPYVTLEDGVLVTRYPTVPHAPVAVTDGVETTADNKSDQTNSFVLPLLALMCFALLIVWTFLRRRRTG